MPKTGKYQESPRDLILWGEGDIDGPAVRGEDVYLKPKGRVSQQWLTACEEERALTADLMEKIVDLSNLTTALRQVLSRRYEPVFSTNSYGFRPRRLRIKQCKRASGIIRFLCSRGVPIWRALLIASSGKGWYRIACSPPAHEAMNLAWFEEIGLFCLYTNYCLTFKETAQYGARTLVV